MTPPLAPGVCECVRGRGEQSFYVMRLLSCRLPKGESIPVSTARQENGEYEQHCDDKWNHDVEQERFILYYTFRDMLLTSHWGQPDTKEKVSLRQGPFINSWLARCCTARGSSIGFSRFSPSKVEARKSFIFTYFENKEHSRIYRQSPIPYTLVGSLEDTSLAVKLLENRLFMCICLSLLYSKLYFLMPFFIMIFW